jgi:hypothetical protein
MNRKTMVVLACAAAAAALCAIATSASTAVPKRTAQVPRPSAPIPVNPQISPDATTTILNPGVVSWVHVGDLHITTGDQQNYADFKIIIHSVNQFLKNGVNFVLLPGDNAYDRTESEYQLIKQATDQLQVPLYVIPGDHDGNTSEDSITMTVNQSGGVRPPERSFGPEGNSVGAYAEKGLLGSHATTPEPAVKRKKG